MTHPIGRFFPMAPKRDLNLPRWRESERERMPKTESSKKKALRSVPDLDDSQFLFRILGRGFVESRKEMQPQSVAESVSTRGA